LKAELRKASLCFLDWVPLWRIHMLKYFLFIEISSSQIWKDINNENNLNERLLIEDFKILAWFRFERTKISCLRIRLWSICCSMQRRKNNIWIAEYWRSLSSFHSSIQSHNRYYQKGMSVRCYFHFVENKYWSMSCHFKRCSHHFVSEMKEPTTIAVRLFLRRTTRQRRLIPMKLDGCWRWHFVSLLRFLSSNKKLFFWFIYSGSLKTKVFFALKFDSRLVEELDLAEIQFEEKIGEGSYGRVRTSLIRALCWTSEQHHIAFLFCHLSYVNFFVSSLSFFLTGSQRKVARIGCCNQRVSFQRRLWKRTQYLQVQ
jgi:hypothetical protein